MGLGLVRLGVEVASHRTNLALIATARTVTGEVLSIGPHGGKGVPSVPSALVGVLDPELGWQVLSAHGDLKPGDHVRLLCTTALARCAVAQDIADNLSAWPFTSAMILGGTCIALGLIVVVARSAIGDRVSRSVRLLVTRNRP